MRFGNQHVALGVLVSLVLLVMGRPTSAVLGANGYVQYDFSYTRGDGQHTNCWCVTSVAQDTLRFIGQGASISQPTLDSYMKQSGHNYFRWQDPAFDMYKTRPCSLSIDDGVSPSYANDSRGLAWALWHYNQPVWGYRDYVSLDGSSAKQTHMNWEIVLGYRTTGDPVPVTVKAGQHEISVVGIYTTYDPLQGAFAGSDNSINGFYVFDPWYNTPWTWNGWGANGGGYYGGSYITLPTWNSSIFTKDTHEGYSYAPDNSPYWNKYVAVLRAHSTADPYQNNHNDIISYGEWYYNIYGAGQSVMTSPSPSDAGTSATYQGTVAGAVAAGLTKNHLFNHVDLGSIPPAYSLGQSLHVESVDPQVPAYEMIEVKAAGQPVAIAIVDDTVKGYEFAEVLSLAPGSSLPSTEQMSSALAASGLSGTPRLEYGPTVEGLMQGTPFLVGTDQNGRPAFADHPAATPLFSAKP